MRPLSSNSNPVLSSAGFARKVLFSVSLCLCGSMMLRKFNHRDTEAQRRMFRKRTFRAKPLELKTGVLHAEFFAQVKPSDFGVFGQILWLARSENPALGHDVGPVSDAESFSYVVIRN